jgi:hypothetical protein
MVGAAGWIHDGETMRTALLLALGLAATGCAHTAPAAPPVEERLVLAVDEAEQEPEPAPLPAAPRLSRTVTLGEASAEAAYTAERPAPPPAPNGNNVVVNNTVVVNQAPGFLPFGYGGIGFGGRGSGGRGEGFGRSAGRSWGASGFEGAGRTAAPGQTPGVGGNWPAAPSHGPAPMR